MARRTIIKDTSDNEHTLAKTRRFVEENKKMDELPDKAPSKLKGAAAKCWEIVVPQLKRGQAVKRLDETLVESLCINYQLMSDSYEMLRDNGSYFVDDKGNLKASPAIGGLDKATKSLKALCRELGMSPSARASLIELAKPQESAETKTTVDDLTKQFG